MKTNTTFVGIAVVLSALGFGCASATGGAGSGGAGAVAPRVCPYGHAAIKEVPVEYGLPPRPMPPELQRRIENLEVVLGGCCYEPPVSPDYVFICTLCRYEFDPISREWGRSHTDPLTFKRPLSAVVRRFPLAHEADAREVYYSQTISAGRVQRESVSFDSDREVVDEADRVAQFIRGCGQAPEPRIVDLFVAKETSYRFRMNGAYGEVSLLPLTGPARGTIVTFLWPTEPPPDDASWTSSQW
jgi:hypothetical protein